MNIYLVESISQQCR